MPFFQIIPPGTRIDFVGRWRLCAALSLLLIGAGVAAIPLRGIQLGVDFAGGYQVIVHVEEGTKAGEDDTRAALASIGIPGANVTRLGEPAEGRFQVKFQAVEKIASYEIVPKLENELSKNFGPTQVESIDFVGPRVGDELRQAAILSMLIAFALVFVYVAFRFSLAYAPGAIIALIHDVLFTAAIFVILGWEFDLNVVAALLTIIGYSINDTIVIYDRIREKRAQRTSTDLTDVVNQSVNETLSRTILTAGATLLAVLALLFLGGPELRGFSAAMAIGIVVGSYSTVYVASPFMLLLERRQGRKLSPRAAAQ